MSLMRLLSVSKSFAGGGNQSGRYRMAEQGLLPKFAPMGRPVSLAPKRTSNEAVPAQETNALTMPLNSQTQQSARAAEPVTDRIGAPGTRAPVCVNANGAPTNWFRLGNRLPGRPKPLAAAELSIEAVKPVRNDLSDSDLQVVPAKADVKVNTDTLKQPHPRWLKTELTGLAWSRLTARFFNSERVRA